MAERAEQEVSLRDLTASVIDNGDSDEERQVAYFTLLAIRCIKNWILKHSAGVIDSD